MPDELVTTEEVESYLAEQESGTKEETPPESEQPAPEGAGEPAETPAVPDTPAPEADQGTYAVNGENVTLEELLSGYMKGKDYSQKTMTLAEERRAMETGDEQRVQETLLEMAEKSPALYKELYGVDMPGITKEPTWSEDPEERYRQESDYNRQQDQEAVKALRNEITGLKDEMNKGREEARENQLMDDFDIETAKHLIFKDPLIGHLAEKALYSELRTGDGNMPKAAKFVADSYQSYDASVISKYVASKLTDANTTTVPPSGTPAPTPVEPDLAVPIDDSEASLDAAHDWLNAHEAAK